MAAVIYPDVNSLWDALTADWGAAGTYGLLLETYLAGAVFSTALGGEFDGTPDLYDVLVTGGIPVWPAAAVPGNNISMSQVIRQLYDTQVITEFEKSQAPATENAVVAVAIVAADQSLGSKDITVDIPAGGTIISVIAAARINIMNNTANAQKIDLKLDVETVTLFDQDDVVGFGAVDGASASYFIAEDASDEVTADAQVVTLEAFATLSAAQSVRFQVQYYLFITYTMG